MKICPDCGTENHDLDGFCSKCSGVLPRDLNTSSTPIEPRPEQRHSAKPKVSESQANDTHKLIKRTEDHLSKLTSQMLAHRCGVAAVLSALLPGLGHVYAEEIGKGITMVLVWVVSVFFFARSCIDSISRAARWGEFGVGFWHLAVGLVLLGFWIYAVVDASCAPDRPRW